MGLIFWGARIAGTGFWNWVWAGFQEEFHAKIHFALGFFFSREIFLLFSKIFLFAFFTVFHFTSSLKLNFVFLLSIFSAFGIVFIQNNT